MVEKMLEEFMPFIGLILSSQGVVAGVNPKILGGLSILVVIIWLIIGTVATNVAMQYSNIITFIGGLAIFLLGVKAIYDAIKHMKSTKGSE